MSETSRTESAKHRWCSELGPPLETSSDAGQVSFDARSMVAIGAVVPDSSGRASMPAKPLPTTARGAAEASNEARAIAASCSLPSPRTFRDSSYSPGRLVPKQLVICVHAEDHSSGQQRGLRLVHMVGGVIRVLLTGVGYRILWVVSWVDGAQEQNEKAKPAAHSPGMFPQP